MTSEFTTARLTNKDIPSVLDLLLRAGLPVDDLSGKFNHFFIAKDGDRVVAAIGLELFGNYGLLRSMVTHPAYRNKGLATLLVNDLMTYARSLSLKEIYLLTQTAEVYFARRGFVNINRDDVPAEVKQSEEFSHLCPSSAVVMYTKVLTQ